MGQTDNLSRVALLPSLSPPRVRDRFLAQSKAMQRAHIKVVGYLKDHPRRLPSCHVSNRPIIVVEIELSDRFSNEPLIERNANVLHTMKYE